MRSTLSTRFHRYLFHFSFLLENFDISEAKFTLKRGDSIVVARDLRFFIAYSCHGSNIVLCNDSTTALR